MMDHSDKGRQEIKALLSEYLVETVLSSWVGKPSLSKSSHTLFPVNQDMVVMTHQKGAWSWYLGDCFPA